MAVDPKCLDASIDFGGVGEGEVVASICGFDLTLPDIDIPPKFFLPSIDFPPPFPIPKLAFSLTCDPDKPIDITAGIEFGGGRIPCYVPNEDDEDEAVAA